jgi:uncharacterized protein (UPF0147 family)
MKIVEANKLEEISKCDILRLKEDMKMLIECIDDWNFPLCSKDNLLNVIHILEIIEHVY